MTALPSARILSLNSGSSGLKAAHFRPGAAPRRIASDTLEPVPAADALVDWLEDQGHFDDVIAVGHRIVHGGPDLAEACIVDDAVLAELERLTPLDPLHMPQERALIAAIAQRRPGLRQVACFDTAFHRAMPRVARQLPLPRRYESAGVVRYGFHGLSYEYLMEELARQAAPRVARGRVILAHLGSGASLVAVRDGKAIDTTMGFTPAGGLMMATRTGDLDPGTLIHVMRSDRLTVDAADDLVNRQSGLLGVSETSADMRALLAREHEDVRAAEAIALYCYQAKKFVGALAAALGGLDGLVFAGGVGEHAPAIRARICDGLEFLGIRLDAERNVKGEGVLSADGATCEVRSIPTDEELMIARNVCRVLRLEDAPPGSPDA